MRALVALLTLTVLLFATPAGASATTNEDLLDACSRKTAVYGRDADDRLIQAGETIDDFCSGYLKATYESMAKSASCPMEHKDPNFLLSVYLQYVKDEKRASTESAYETLVSAFRRISNCN